MQLSARICGIVGGNGDDGWSVHYRGQALARAGEKVTLLSVGEHDIPTDRRILDAMRASQMAGNLGYASVRGAAGLRRAVAERVSARSALPVAADEVQITAGGQAGLFAAMSAVLDPGQSCIVLDPYYATYSQTVRAVGGHAITVATRAEEGFQPDIDAIAAAIAPDTRAILINTPNNPTGAVYTAERLAALAGLVRTRDLWLISDEVYDVQIHDGRHLSPRDLPGMAERTLVVNSLSKSHAMTGSRIGWLIGPAPAMDRLAELGNATTYGVAGYIQDAAEFALNEGGTIEAEIAARYRRRRDAALAALGNGPGVRVTRPAGGMYLMLDVRETGLTGIAFAERLLEEERITVMPGESFGQAAAGHLRVALTRPEPELVEALTRIARFAARLT